MATDFFLGVILARGGSKRVPGKNLREYLGKPLVQWAIEHAKASKLNHVILSTDDEKIAALGWSLRVDVHIRPKDLATDTASSEDALRYILQETPADWVVLLQPTSPLRTAEDIDACIERAQMGDGCISVGPEGFTNGAVYVARREWIEKHDFSHLGLMKYRMPEERSLDIDEEADFAS